MKGIRITLAGKKNDGHFMQCHTALGCIKKKNPAIEIVVLPLFETEWEEYLRRIQKTLGGRFILHKKSPLIFVNNDEYIGGPEEFMNWAEDQYDYHDTTNIVLYNKKSVEMMRKSISETPSRKYAFMDFQLGKEPPAMVIFELFYDVAPLTCNNFIELCKGFTTKKGKTVGYKGSTIHRVVPQIFAQGGNIEKGKNLN
jgi:hypothetical protein